MDKNSKSILDILIRYVILIAVAFPGLWIFYAIFTPLTSYSLHFIFNLFFNSQLTGSLIFLSSNSSSIIVELVNACIGGSAYYLLLILNLSTPKIPIKKRIKMISIAFFSFLILNLLRVFILSLMLLYDATILFEITHRLFWYIGSIIFIIGIWFTEVRLFNLKEIPFCSDIKFLYKSSKLKK